MTRDRKEIKTSIEEKLRWEYPCFVLDGRPTFRTSSGGYIRLDTLGGADNGIIIEWAENLEEAKNNRFEDDDLFPVDAFSDDEITDGIKRAIAEY